MRIAFRFITQFFRPCSEMLRRGGVGQGLSEPGGYLLHKTWDLWTVCNIWLVKTPNIPWWDIYFPAYSDQVSYQVRPPYQRVRTTSHKIIPQRPQTTRRTTWRVEGAHRWLSSRGPSARTSRSTPAFNQGPAPLTAGVTRISKRSPPSATSLEFPKLNPNKIFNGFSKKSSCHHLSIHLPGISVSMNASKSCQSCQFPKLIPSCHTRAQHLATYDDILTFWQFFTASEYQNSSHHRELSRAISH